MLRHLRIAVSVTSLVACMLLIALWLRSYWWFESLRNDVSQSYSFMLECHDGRLVFFGLPWANNWSWELVTYRLSDLRSPDEPDEPIEMWAYHSTPVYGRAAWSLVIPHWFLVILTGTLAAVLGIRRPFQFSLRTMMIAMTIIALWLGLVVSLI